MQSFLRHVRDESVKIKALPQMCFLICSEFNLPLLVQVNFVKSLGILMAQEGDILVNLQRNGEWSIATINPYLSATLQIGSIIYKMQPMGSEGQNGADDQVM